MKKSDNTKGNPYHDDEGKFTNKNDVGSEKNDLNIHQIKLKPNVDLSNIQNALKALADNQKPIIQNGQVDVSTPLTMPTSIQDAEMQGNRILGSSGAVGYADDTDLAVAHEFNKALYDVVSDFPKLYDNEQLYLYGTADKRQYSQDLNVSIKADYDSINSILNRPQYQQRLKELKLKSDDILDVMRYSLTKAKKNFGIDPEKGCGGFTSMSDFNNVFHVLNTHNVIKFNNHYSKSIDKWNLFPKDAIELGHFLPIGNSSGAYMVAIHENGHHIFEKLVDLMNEQEQVQLRKILTADTDGRFDFRNLVKERIISKYATVSRHEHIAEAFANVYCMRDQATQHNKNIVLFLKGVYNRIYGTNN